LLCSSCTVAETLTQSSKNLKSLTFKSYARVNVALHSNLLRVDQLHILQYQVQAGKHIGWCKGIKFGRCSYTSCMGKQWKRRKHLGTTRVFFFKLLPDILVEVAITLRRHHFNNKNTFTGFMHQITMYCAPPPPPLNTFHKNSMHGPFRFSQTPSPKKGNLFPPVVFRPSQNEQTTRNYGCSGQTSNCPRACFIASNLQCSAFTPHYVPSFVLAVYVKEIATHSESFL